MKKRLSILAVLATILAVSVGFSAGAANAADSPQNVTVTSTTVSVDNPTISVGGVSVAAADIASGAVTIGAFVKAHGEPHRLVAKAKAEGACMKIGQGSGSKIVWYWNSFIDANGVKHWFRSDALITVCHIDGVWVKVGPTNCGNTIRFKMPTKNVVTGRVIIVRTFAHVQEKLQAHVGVSISGLCGEATVSASASSEAWVYISLKVFVRAHGSVSANIYGKIVEKLEESATATIVCNAPPPSQTPPTITCTTLNDLDAGGSSPNYSCQVTCPGTDSCKLTLSSAYGHFDPAAAVYFSGDPSPFVYTYYAPSEVPPGGQDTITAIAYDLTDGSSAQWVQSFNINPPPPST